MKRREGSFGGDVYTVQNKYRRGNADNVDLNRDFAVNREAKAIWRHLLPNRYGTSEAPLSQPESRALDALAEAERYDVAVSLHAFGGFFYQLYNAGRQFQRYAAHPENWRYRAGQTNQIQYHPNIACGTSPVYIRNQATAGLYVYTPYQPSAAPSV